MAIVTPEQGTPTTDEGRGRAGTVVVIVGPTAVGKSDLGLALGQRLGGELISADSRQIYRYLDIGTAKPTVAERLLIPHHLVDIVAPDQEYSLASFQEDACRAIAGVLARGRLPLLVGGTGLYVRAVVEGLRIPRVAPQPELRARLEERAAGEGTAALHRQLQSLDPLAAARIDARNVRRVVRALEVCLMAGQPFSELQGAQTPECEFVLIGLTCRRDTLYRRIDARVDRQIADGLVEEMRRVVALGYGFDLPAMTGLGHRQIGLYLQGKLSLAEAIEMDKHDTHRFVRQQYAWFRLSDPRIHWLDRDESDWDDLVQRAEAIVTEAIGQGQLVETEAKAS